MDERPAMPRTELEAAILELFQQLPPQKQKIMMLSAMFSAKATTGPKDEFMETFERLTRPQKEFIALIVAMNAACNEEDHK